VSAVDRDEFDASSEVTRWNAGGDADAVWREARQIPVHSTMLIALNFVDALVQQ